MMSRTGGGNQGAMQVLEVGQLQAASTQQRLCFQAARLRVLVTRLEGSAHPGRGFLPVDRGRPMAAEAGCEHLLRARPSSP